MNINTKLTKQPIVSHEASGTATSQSSKSGTADYELLLRMVFEIQKMNYREITAYITIGFVFLCMTVSMFFTVHYLNGHNARNIIVANPSTPSITTSINGSQTITIITSSDSKTISTQTTESVSIKEKKKEKQKQKAIRRLEKRAAKLERQAERLQQKAARLR